jgi:hypothetical protein
MRRTSKVLLLLGLAVVLSAPSAQAQVQTTVVLKSGQRHTGTNLGYRVDRREVAVRTSQSEEPRVPVDQVAYIDFGGTSDPPNMNLSGSQEAVVMRDGSIQKGQILDIGHTDPANQSTPFVVVYKAEGGEERRVPASQVARVYFAGGQPSSGSGGSSGGGSIVQPPAGQGYTVSSQQQWTTTGLVLNRGEAVTVRTTGEISIAGSGARFGPGGTGEMHPANPVPSAQTGALIARVGNGQPFLVGTQTRIVAPTAGQLMLGINDSHVADNQGAYQVEVQRAGRTRR